ncbi:MAG: TonB-dependent receptor [Planctomycetes bacterium]|nr:TonB-dependent receptor [Planctomycetota bacterium]
MKKSIYSAVFVLSASSLIVADGPVPAPVPKSEEITVTATKTPKSVKNSPAIVEIINSDEIDKKNPLTFDEALRNISGLYAYRGHGVSTVTPFVSLRGTGYQSRTLVLVDNQALNEYYYHGGGVNFNAIPVESIERIEVVKGPFSSLYGGNAMGGVINVITKTPEHREADLKTSLGSFGSQVYHLSYADRFGWFGLALNADKKEADGYEDFFVLKKPSSGTASTVVTGWKKTTDNFGTLNYLIGSYGNHVYNDETVKLKLFFELSADSKLELSVLKNTENREHTNETSYLIDQNGKTVNSGTVQISDNGSNYKINVKSADFLYTKNWKDVLLTTLYFEHKLNEKTKLHTHFGITEQNRSLVAPKTLPKGELNYTPFRNIQFEQQADIKINPQHTLTCGIELRQISLFAEVYSLYDWDDKGSQEQLISKGEGATRTTGLYLQDEYNLLKNLTLYPGVRMDYWKNYNGSYYDSTYAAGKQTIDFSDNSEQYASPKLSLVYEPLYMTVVKTSWGKAFRGPGPDDLYRNSIIYAKSMLSLSNPELKPETISSYELSVERYFSDTTKITAAAWHSQMKDMLYKVFFDAQEVTDYNSLYGTNYLSIRENQNVGESEINGLEFAVSHRIFSSLAFIGNYTYTSTKIVDYEADDAIEGKRFVDTPLHNANMTLEYERGGFFYSTTGRYVSKRYASDDNLDKITGGYGSEDQFFVFSANFAYKIPAPNLTFSLSVDNIFDKEYYDTYIVPGRTYAFGVEYVF